MCFPFMAKELQIFIFIKNSIKNTIKKNSNKIIISLNISKAGKGQTLWVLIVKK